jgi:hypothetical protein
MNLTFGYAIRKASNLNITRGSGLFRKHERSILPELVMELKALNGFESEINPVSSKNRFYFPLSK